MEQEYALYKALQTYNPSSQSQSEQTLLSFQKDDIFEVVVHPYVNVHNRHENKTRLGLIYGYNRRTGAEGYIPGMFPIL